MNAATQAELFDPTGSRVIELAVMHRKRAEGFRLVFDRCDGWGFSGAVKRHYSDAAIAEDTEADCLAMLADLERLGGIA